MAVPISNIDLNNNKQNPYPIYTILRDQFPVCQLANGMVALSRYDDISTALSSPHIFSEGAAVAARSDWLPEDCKREIFLIPKSPPEHGKYRVLVNRAFIGTVIKNYVPWMQERAAQLIDAMPNNAPVDFLERFSYPYASTISCLTMGIDASIYDKYADDIRRWGALSEINTPNAPPEHRAAIIDATRNLNAIYDEIFLERQKNPRDDVFTALMNATVDGRPLSEREIRGALDLLLSAGFISTSQFLVNAMLELAHNIELRQMLTANPEHIPDFIEELLRHNNSSHSVMRQTAQPITLHGATIPSGSLIQLLIASGNRDERQFEEPDKFIMERPNVKKHLGFGHGVHICLGAALVRLEVKIALEAFLTRFSRIECPPAEQLQWQYTLFTRGVESLPITLS